MPPSAFAGLPAHERQAFFSLLDEYFESRPHLMPGAGASAGGDAAYAQAAPASGFRGQPPPPAARKPATSMVHTTPAAPAGLTTGKSVGRMNMQNKGAAFGSMIMGKPRPEAPNTAGEAISGIAAAPPPRAAAAVLPPPPPPAAVEPNALGQAEVLYDYVGQEAEDLGVKRYDIIDLVEKVSDDWWKGRSRDGRTGIVPSSYVRQI